MPVLVVPSCFSTSLSLVGESPWRALRSSHRLPFTTKSKLTVWCGSVPSLGDLPSLFLVHFSQLHLFASPTPLSLSISFSLVFGYPNCPLFPVVRACHFILLLVSCPFFMASCFVPSIFSFTLAPSRPFTCWRLPCLPPLTSQFSMFLCLEVKNGRLGCCFFLFFLRFFHVFVSVPSFWSAWLSPVRTSARGEVERGAFLRSPRSIRALGASLWARVLFSFLGLLSSSPCCLLLGSACFSLSMCLR